MISSMYVRINPLLRTLLFICCCLSSCGYTNEVCIVDCEDTSTPGSYQGVRLEDYSCDECKGKYGELKAEICAPLPNPDCLCTYSCGEEHYTY